VFGVGAYNPLWGAGFVCNPFRTLSDEEWEQVALVPERVRASFDSAPDIPLQILGERGRGKSSALRALAGWGKRQGVSVAYEYLPEGSDRYFTALAGVSLFCVDEAQRLSKSEWERLVRNDVRLVLGTHEDFTPRMSPLETVSLDRPDADHGAAVWNRRLEYFARGSEVERARLTPQALRRLQERFGSDLRSAERFLYRYFQETVRAPHEITGAEW
jgi:hypothetical protein